ncbi:hypothetical protein WH47_11015, partial [Habropoda laboriosa]
GAGGRSEGKQWAPLPAPPPPPAHKVRSGAAKLARPLRTAAVTVTLVPGSNESYAGVIATARENIRFEVLGIPEVRPRSARTGGLIFEVAVPEKEAKAEALSLCLREVLQERAQVAHPTKNGEVRVSGLDNSVKAEEVAAICGCPFGGVRTGEIRRKLATVGRIKVGWCAASAEALKARPMQCYRCLEVGHTRRQQRRLLPTGRPTPGGRTQESVMRGLGLAGRA